MSTRNKCRHPLRSFTDAARDLVRLLVDARSRWHRDKVQVAIEETAVELGIARNRVWRLNYDYGEPMSEVGEDEWDQLRERAAEILLREADELERWACHYRDRALALKYLQPTLFGEAAPCLGILPGLRGTGGAHG